MKKQHLLSHRTLLISGLLLYALTAWYSEGYHHPDEHFQILEFAQYKLGRSTASELPWEFSAQIRPGLQPFLAYAAIRMAEMSGIRDPFIQAFLMRWCSGWLCLWVYFRWAARLERETPGTDTGKWLRWSVLLLWFVPYLSVRFSSENMAGCSFAAGALLLLNNVETPHNRHRIVRLMLAGLLLGLSFFFRYQMAFALMGLGAWLLLQQRRTEQRPATLPYLLPGAALALLIGLLTDAWLYSRWSFPAYHYFVSNIVDNKAADWGVSPWWYYFTETFATAVPPLSILLLFFLSLGCWAGRRSLLAWSFLPFLLAHMLVGHKELRFLYPMLLPVLVLSVQGMTQVRQYLSTHDTARRWYLRLFRFALCINIALLPARCLLAAQESVACYRFLYHYAADAPLRVFSHKKFLYEVVGLNMNFYRAPHIQNTLYIDIKAKTVRAGDLLLSQDLQLKQAPPGVSTQRIYAYFPDWILNVNLNDWQSRTRMWSVHEVGGE